MEPLDTVTAPPVVLPDADVDTDIIFPARFLLLLERNGLSRHLFHERRRPVPGQQPFVLDRPPFERAEILVAGRNFGCGSSREQAVWALADFGIRAIVAPSFGEIFQANCFRNGLLPIPLDAEAHQRVLDAATTGAPLEISLERLEIGLPGRECIPFSVDPERRRDLLLGRDEIETILGEEAEAIAAFEQRRRRSRPWLDLGEEELLYVRNLGSEDM